MAYFLLFIFTVADGLENSCQLSTGLNKIHIVILDIHVLQFVVVGQVYRS